MYLLKTDKTAAMGRKLAMAKETHQVFFMTPQILLNNINSQQISLPEISLLIMDECHHTRKREPYNNVMKQYLTLKRRGDKCLPLPQVGDYLLFNTSVRTSDPIVVRVIKAQSLSLGQ